MLKILANENVETEEDRTQYQIDTVLAVKRYLVGQRMSNQKYIGRGGDHRSKEVGAIQISDWLGKENCDFRCSH